MQRLQDILTWLWEAIAGTPDPTCLNPEELAASSTITAWPQECRELKLHCDFRGLRGLSQAQFRNLAQQACRNASSVSALSITLTDDIDEANIHFEGLKMATRGGPSGWCYYPRDCAYVVQGRMNSNTYWTADSFLMAFVHELGHAFGLPHTTNTRDIMYPKLISGRSYIKGTYGPHYSGPEMVKRYGPSH